MAKAKRFMAEGKRGTPVEQKGGGRQFADFEGEARFPLF